jgi:hypothetical protein
MQGSTVNIVEIVLLSGYILFSSTLNIFALLISSFYKKSLNKTSPKAGFVVAILLALLFLVFHILEQKGILLFQVLSIIALLGSGLASIMSILALFFTMNKIQK